MRWILSYLASVIPSSIRTVTLHSFSLDLLKGWWYQDLEYFSWANLPKNLPSGIIPVICDQASNFQERNQIAPNPQYTCIEKEMLTFDIDMVKCQHQHENICKTLKHMEFEVKHKTFHAQLVHKYQVTRWKQSILCLLYLRPHLGQLQMDMRRHLWD